VSYRPPPKTAPIVRAFAGLQQDDEDEENAGDEMDRW